MKKLGVLFAVLGILLSDVMCAVVAYQYRGMLCGIEHQGFSAPAGTAFLYAIPFAAGILLCVALAILFRKKSGSSPCDPADKTENGR